MTAASFNSDYWETDMTKQQQITRDMFIMSTAASGEAFFYANAGYSYDPKTETEEQGRIRCARDLARAELWAEKQGYRFEWMDDDINSSFYNDDLPVRNLYCCQMWAVDGRTPVQSLGGIDAPEQDGYFRVIQAELASQQYHDEERRAAEREELLFTKD